MHLVGCFIRSMNTVCENSKTVSTFAERSIESVIFILVSFLSHDKHLTNHTVK